MPILHCTANLMEHMNLDKKLLQDSSTKDKATLGNWYANLVTMDKRKTIIFTNEETLFSFVTTGVTKNSHQRVVAALFVGIWHLLRRKKIEEAQVISIHEEYKNIDFAKTQNRRILGSMNDIVRIFEIMIRLNGGWNECNLDEVTDNINCAPMKYLDYKSPVDCFNNLLKL